MVRINDFVKCMDNVGFRFEVYGFIWVVLFVEYI